MRHSMPFMHIRFVSLVLALTFLCACAPETPKDTVSDPAPEQAAIMGIRVSEESEPSAEPEDPIPTVTESPEQSYEPSPEPSPVPEKTEPEEQGDLINAEDLQPDPESHYIFRPKVSSAYLEEVFGKTMCETWFNLVDAVLAGEDTFACPDQHTYDWVMGQFPERCLPVLTDLIDYAWDRENSVIDGVANFTYLVPPEEVKEKIAAFGEQVEGILNDALEDDYTDLEKCLALYDYFTKHYTYDYDAAERMEREYLEEISCIRFFNNLSGVCQEISAAYSYLLTQAGVDATVMSGTRSYDHAGHAWSYVRIDGKDYHIDPTYAIGDWDSLSYFMMTDEQREAEDCYGRETFVICSNYTQDYPHPDYAADDDSFRPVWGYYLEAIFPDEEKLLCSRYDFNGGREYVEYNYGDHTFISWTVEEPFEQEESEYDNAGDV